jgi:hypothetical protein
MYQDKIGECDRELQEHLKQMVSKVDLKRQPLGPRPKGKKAKRNTPRFDLRTELYRITGVDWAQVNGIDVNVAQTVIAEVGVDPREFPSERNFASWLGLSPANETSGGKVLSRRTRHVANRAAVAFRQAASTLIRSQRYAPGWGHPRPSRQWPASWPACSIAHSNTASNMSTKGVPY